jgi:hypothetical protein
MNRDLLFPQTYYLECGLQSLTFEKRAQFYVVQVNTRMFRVQPKVYIYVLSQKEILDCSPYWCHYKTKYHPIRAMHCLVRHNLIR